MIRYKAGDATCPRGSDPRVIVHICNTFGGWGAGFVLSLSRRWKSPEGAYRSLAKAGGLQLGVVQYIEVEPDLWVANMVAQEGYGSRAGSIPLRYEALRDCLKKVALFVSEKGASVHMPRMGCGLAGGDWTVVERIIEDELTSRGIQVTVYDLK